MKFTHYCSSSGSTVSYIGDADFRTFEISAGKCPVCGDWCQIVQYVNNLVVKCERCGFAFDAGEEIKVAAKRYCEEHPELIVRVL